jgi:hypothetical protein
MAKENGLGASIAIDDSTGTARTVSNDVRDVTISTPKATLDTTGLDKSAMERISTPKATLDTTGLDKSAMERIQLLTDAIADVNGIYHDTATTGLYTVLKTISSTSVVRALTFTVSANALAMEMLFNDMKLSRGGDGSLLLSTQGQLADGALPTWG